MGLCIARNSFQTVRSITIPAPVAASVVHTNVDAGHAAAFRPLVFVFLYRQAAVGKLLQQPAVNAMAMGNAVWFQVDLFRAGLQHKVVFTRNIGQLPGKFYDFLIGKRGKAQTIHVGLGVAVEVHKADDTLAGIALQPSGQLAEKGNVIVHRVPVGEQNRVIPPNHPFGAYLAGKFLKGRKDHVVLAGYTRFHVFSIGCQGELKIERVRPQFFQAWHQRQRILGPENNAIHYVQRQGNMTHLMEVHRVADADIALPDTIVKPIGIIGGNIGPPAGTDDQGIHLRVALD